MGRVKNAVNRVNTRLNIKMAATLLAGSSLLSSLLGLFRERLLNSNFYGNFPDYLDAYTAAFIIPDFMYFILVSGALSVTFIPVFNDRMQSGNKKSAWELSSSMINFMALLTCVASVLIMIFADQLVWLVAPGLHEEARGLAASMMRVIAINPFLFSISSVIASMQQAVGRFTFYALAPTIYNIGIIIGITVFTNGINIFGWQIFEGGIMGVALGVVLGSVMQLVVSSIGLIGLGFDYDFKVHWKNQGFLQALHLLPARSLDQGIDYVNSIVETNMASRMAAGSVRVYNQALTLHSVPINLIGVAISTAAFPGMTERLSQGRPDLFRIELQKVIRVIVWLALPVAVITYFCRGYLVNFLFLGGEPVVADALGILAFAILFRSVYHIASRAFYAQKDTKTPLLISIFTIGLNITLAIIFSLVLNMKVWGLALAQATVAAVEVFILFSIINYRIPKLFDASFLRALLKILCGSTLMGIVTYVSVKMLDFSIHDQSFWASFPKFAVIVIISAAAYLFLTSLMKLSESQDIAGKLKAIMFSQIKPRRR